ncbi:MAG: nucleotidyltransferase [Planctomycetes bacterium]|nr:nucleotidyltransferase [Planctomycetota bacterium]
MPKKRKAVAPQPDLTAALKAVCQWLASLQVPFAIVGGVAAAAYGRARATKDVDATADLAGRDLEAALKLAKQFGIERRPEHAETFRRGSRVLLLQHAPTSTNIDVALALFAIEMKFLGRARQVHIDDWSFPIATPEDILVMKLFAWRPQDVRDIENILAVQKRLNLKQVREDIKGLAEIMEDPAIAARLDSVLKPMDES